MLASELHRNPRGPYIEAGDLPQHITPSNEPTCAYHKLPVLETKFQASTLLLDVSARACPHLDEYGVVNLCSLVCEQHAGAQAVRALRKVLKGRGLYAKALHQALCALRVSHGRSTC